MALDLAKALKYQASRTSLLQNQVLGGQTAQQWGRFASKKGLPLENTPVLKSELALRASEWTTPWGCFYQVSNFGLPRQSMACLKCSP